MQKIGMNKAELALIKKLVKKQDPKATLKIYNTHKDFIKGVTDTTYKDLPLFSKLLLKLIPRLDDALKEGIKRHRGAALSPKSKTIMIEKSFKLRPGDTKAEAILAGMPMAVGHELGHIKHFAHKSKLKRKKPKMFDILGKLEQESTKKYRQERVADIFGRKFVREYNKELTNLGMSPRFSPHNALPSMRRGGSNG